MAMAMTDSEVEILKQLAEIFTYSLVPLPRVATSAAPPGAEIPIPTPILLPIAAPDPPPPPVHLAPVSENTNADASLPRVAEETQVQVDPTYEDMVVNPGKRRRAKAKAKKKAEALAYTQLVPVVAPPPQIDHPHGTRSKTGPPQTSFTGGISIPTHEANFLSTAIGELFENDESTSLPDSTGQANAVTDPNSGASLKYSQLLKGPDSEQWICTTANEIARLAQGQENGPTGTNTMFFYPSHCSSSTHKTNLPAYRGRHQTKQDRQIPHSLHGRRQSNRLSR
jgi:hypothetical protein